MCRGWGLEASSACSARKFPHLLEHSSIASESQNHRIRPHSLVHVFSCILVRGENAGDQPRTDLYLQVLVRTKSAFAHFCKEAKKHSLIVVVNALCVNGTLEAVLPLCLPVLLKDNYTAHTTGTRTNARPACNGRPELESAIFISPESHRTNTSGFTNARKHRGSPQRPLIWATTNKLTASGQGLFHTACVKALRLCTRAEALSLRRFSKYVRSFSDVPQLPDW